MAYISAHSDSLYFNSSMDFEEKIKRCYLTSGSNIALPAGRR